MEYRVDILIVGAGIAGLRCGIELLNQNPKKTVLILEKYNYSGGRVVTYSTEVDSKKYQWENGAGRISDTHLKVHDLINKYGHDAINKIKSLTNKMRGNEILASVIKPLRVSNPAIRKIVNSDWLASMANT